MSKIDENGNMGYYKAPLWLAIRSHIKANVLRFIANVDAFWWMLRKRR